MLRRTAGLALLAAWAWTPPVQGELIHRYSFNEADGTTVADSVGTANGEIKGTSAFFDGAGKLVLPGGTTSAATPEEIAGYVDLPNHLINVLTNLTIETWVTWDGQGSWQRIFDLGTSAGGEDISDGNGNYLFLSPAGDVNLRFAVREPVTGTEPTQLTSTTPLEFGTEICITVTYDAAANVSRLFSNAVQLATGPAGVPLSSINDVNNWLGRSQWGPDGMFQGSYNEFRIYNAALNPIEVAASYTAGVAQPSTDPASLGALQAVVLTVPTTTMKELDTQTALGVANFAAFSGLPLAGVAGVSIISDKPDVLTVDAAGLVTAVKAGVAKLTLSYLGQTDEETITVNPRQAGAVVAGTLVVDLRAADTSTDASTWPNRAGTGDFTATGTPTYVADVEGTGIPGVRLNPVPPTAEAYDAYEGPSTTEELHGASDRSIEVWAYNPTIADEETLVSLGRRGGPDGSNTAFNYGANATYGAVGHWGAPDMGWSGTPAAGQWHYLVYTYDGISTAKVFADGLLKYSEVVGVLNTHADFPIRVGGQADSAGTGFEPGFSLSGYLAMVRVHTGQLSDADVANNYLFGPNVLPPGELEGVKLTLNWPTLTGERAVGQALFTADYANLKNVNVLAFGTLESSDPTVLTVATNGVYTALKLGTATLKGTYQGREATQLVTVVDAPGLELKHRYSFSDSAAGTTVKDSVGTADGVVKGTGATFDGAGKLALPGGTLSNADAETIAGYVDLPNGIISSLVNATFEAWVTWDGSGSWQRIFDFGTSGGGEDISNGNGAYLFMSPQGDANLRFAARDPRTGGEPTQLTSAAPLATGTEVYIAATYDYTRNQAVLYSNAVQVATGPAAVPLNLINDVNNWLGRAQWGDNMFQGSFNEFRIWEGALPADRVAANFAAGPDQLPTVVTPTISISSGGIITYTGTLESSATVNGGYAPVTGATSPYTAPKTGGAMFYRSKQ